MEGLVEFEEEEVAKEEKVINLLYELLLQQVSRRREPSLRKGNVRSMEDRLRTLRHYLPEL